MKLQRKSKNLTQKASCSDDDFVWNKIFFEIAIRAIRQVHVKYGMWGLGQEPKDETDFTLLNQGPGIEVALETEVCAAITQEFINSRFTNGLFEKNHNRHYEIDREVKYYLSKRSYHQIDLFVNKFKTEDGLKYYKFPAIIQVKRAHYYTPEIATGNLNSFQTNWKAIRSDIRALRQIRKLELTPDRAKYFEKIENHFLYILFWGVFPIPEKKYEATSQGDVKTYIKKQLRTRPLKENDIYLKWIPLTWDGDKGTVTKWLWVAMIEIDILCPRPPTGRNSWIRIRKK